MPDYPPPPPPPGLHDNHPLVDDEPVSPQALLPARRSPAVTVLLWVLIAAGAVIVLGFALIVVGGLFAVSIPVTPEPQPAPGNGQVSPDAAPGTRSLGPAGIVVR